VAFIDVSMNLLRISCCPVEGAGIWSYPSDIIHGAGRRRHLQRDVQDNFYSTRTSEGLHSQTPVFSSSLICTTNSKKCRYARSSPGRLQPQLHTNSGTWIPQGMGFKSKFDLLQPHAAESDTTLTSRSMDSDSVEDESLETSTGSNIEDLLSVSGEDSDVQSRGKAGFVSFHSPRLGKEQHRSTPFQNIIGPVYDNKRNWSSVLWLIGPLALVCSVVGPPLYLRRFFESILEDSLLTDFVILFCTEALFYAGVSLFLFVSHKQRLQQSPSLARAFGETVPAPINYPMGYRVSMTVSLALGVVLPLVCFAVVWPWTGPAAAAALLPYLVGLAVQLGFERTVRTKKSPVWPLVPVTFQVYRLHQLNRAAQLVAGLLFSLKGVEATPETMAINGSLQSLLSVVQLLGILCLWSLGSYLMHHFPSWPQQNQAISTAESQ